MTTEMTAEKKAEAKSVLLLALDPLLSVLLLALAAV
jgi:hypothetical protein